MAWPHSFSVRLVLRPAAPLVAIALLFAAGAVQAQDGNQILLDSLEPHPITYVGEQVTEVVGSGKPLQRQRVYRSATRLRIEFPGGQVVLDDGLAQLRYYPTMRIVERGPSDLNAPRSRFVRKALSTGRAVVERQPDDTVASRPAYVVLLRDTRGRRSPRRIWIDMENSIQLRQDVEQESGQVQSTRFTSIRFGREPSSAKMQPTWPANTPMVPRVPGRPLPLAAAMEVARAWGGLLTPRQLPSGFRLRGYYQQGHSTRPRIAAIYDDFATRRILSITQHMAPTSPPSPRSVGSSPGRERHGREQGEQKEGISVTALRGPAKVTVAGPLLEPQLRQVLDSLQ